jgi:hypothetical protein
MNDNRDYYLVQRPADAKKYTNRFTNSLTFNGHFALTPKWNFGFETGYNITEKTITPSSFRIERDVHCWIFSFKWQPFGAYRSFEFEFRAKANILQDAKLPQKRNYTD